MGKIIVVEDNLVYSRYVCNFLEENGYRTVSTSDCTGARKLFSMLEDDDIVLADLRLPDGDGILLLEELRREGKHNPYGLCGSAYRRAFHEIRSGRLYPQETADQPASRHAPRLAEKAVIP